MTKIEKKVDKRVAEGSKELKMLGGGWQRAAEVKKVKKRVAECGKH